MKTSYLLCMGAIASAAYVASSAFAADASVTTAQAQNGPLTTTAQNRVAPAARSAGGGQQRMDNMNGGPASAYTPVPQWSDFDVPTNFPTRNLSLPPRTGSDVIPDYMGPGSVRGQ